MYQTEICIGLLIISSIITWTMIYCNNRKIDDLMCGKGKKVTNADKYYNILKHYYPQADALYEDTIINLVGREGLKVLRESRRIEACANFDERKIYAL